MKVRTQRHHNHKRLATLNRFRIPAVLIVAFAVLLAAAAVSPRGAQALEPPDMIYTVLVSSPKTMSMAKNIMNRLAKMDFPEEAMDTLRISDYIDYYPVRIGRYKTLAQARKLKKIVARAYPDSIIIRINSNDESVLILASNQKIESDEPARSRAMAETRPAPAERERESTAEPQKIYTILVESSTDKEHSLWTLSRLAESLSPDDSSGLRICEWGKYFPVRLGYFQSQNEARKLLRKVRASHPKAIISSTYAELEVVAHLHGEQGRTGEDAGLAHEDKSPLNDRLKAEPIAAVQDQEGAKPAPEAQPAEVKADARREDKPSPPDQAIQAQAKQAVDAEPGAVPKPLAGEVEPLADKAPPQAAEQPLKAAQPAAPVKPAAAPPDSEKLAGEEIKPQAPLAQTDPRAVGDPPAVAAKPAPKTEPAPPKQAGPVEAKPKSQVLTPPLAAKKAQAAGSLGFTEKPDKGAAILDYILYPGMWIVLIGAIIFLLMRLQVSKKATSRRKKARGGAVALWMQAPQSYPSILENLRQVKNTLNLIQQEQEAKVFLFTGPSRGVGVTSLSCNLSMVLAKDIINKHFLIVDANISRPSLHDVFGLPLSPGLRDYLTNGDKLKDIVKPTSLPNLHVVTAGQAMDQTGSPFDLPRFDNFIKSVRDNFDYILIDSAPALHSSHSRILSPKVDGVITVAEAEVTRREVLLRLKRQLELDGAKIVGGILNKRRYVIPRWLYNYV